MSGDLFGWDTCEFSPDPERKWRYVLRRRWGDGSGSAVLVCMLNPSTADEVNVDPTVKRCVDFANAMGFHGLTVVNLFAWRATRPADMRRAGRLGENVVGPDNDDWLQLEAEQHDVCVAAWGNGGEYLGRAADVLERGLLGDLWCWGKTGRGNPRHPLYLRAVSTLVPL